MMLFFFKWKVEITIRNLNILNIQPLAYKSLLKPVSTSKLPTNLRTLFAWNFSDIAWELNALLILFKNKLRAKERSLNSGYNFKEKQDKIGNFSTYSLFSGTQIDLFIFWR